MTLPTPPRKQWFLDRIGTRVWPTKGICKCAYCKECFEQGAFINNRVEAEVFYTEELSDDQLTYFSTKEERDEHARTNPN